MVVLEKQKKAIESITEDFDLIEQLADNGITGEIVVRYDFDNEIQLNKVLSHFSSKYDSYKHNFQVGDITVMLLWER